MKKLVLSLAAICAAVSLNAQTTITSHFEGAISDPSPANWNIGFYNWGPGNGYITGTNTYGDKAIVQKFDAGYGVSGAGTIDNVKILIARKDDSGNAESVTVGVWADNAGVPGALLGSEVVTIASIDTAVASTQFIFAGASVVGLYNVDVTFSTPVNIPANNSFFTGITVPDGANGDTLIVTSTVMPGYVFADASTHAGAVNSVDGFDAFGTSSVNISSAIFPTITLSSSSINENVISTSVYPNPASDVLNIVADEEIASVSVVGLDGKVVATSLTSTVNVSELISGMYIYEVTTTSGKVSRNSFMKK